jgi:type VI secretion system protein ImpA
VFEDPEGNMDELAHEALNGIHQVCLDRLGPETSPDFSVLSGLIAQLLQPAAGSHSNAELDAAEAGATAGLTASATTGAVSASPISGDIRSREDAHRVLGLVCTYLERHEPTNPAPLLIRRAQRMMTMDFMAIIKELAPDSLNQVQLITGAEGESY